MGVEVQLVIAGIPGRIPAVLKDISESGCFFATSAPVKLAWTVSLSFLIKPRELCEAHGQVVRADSGHGFGVEFEDVNGSLIGLVAALLSAPLEERSALLQSLCDPVIELGYLRRPDPADARPAEPPRPLPPECPKCGCATAGGPPDACVRCGLVFSLWTPARAEEEPRLDTPGEALWAEATAGWASDERHDAFLKHCSLAGLLPVAGRRYRDRLDRVPDDAVAVRMQERIMAMATAQLVRTPAPSAKPVTRNHWFWVIILIAGLGGGITAATMRVADLKPQVEPPAAVVGTTVP